MFKKNVPVVNKFTQFYLISNTQKMLLRIILKLKKIQSEYA